MMESIALNESHVAHDDDYVMVQANESDLDEDSYDDCDEDLVRISPITSTSMWVCSGESVSKGYVPNDLEALIEDSMTASTVSLENCDDGEEYKTNDLDAPVDDVDQKGKEDERKAEMKSGIDAEPPCEAKKMCEADVTDVDVSMDISEAKMDTEAEAEPTRPVSCKVDGTNAENPVKKNDDCGEENLNLRSCSSSEKKESTTKKLKSVPTVTISPKAQPGPASRLSNKKRRKKVKMLKKAAAAAAATVALTQQQSGTVTPPSPTPENSTKQPRNKVAKNRTKQKPSHIGNLAVSCATESLSSYRQEHNLKLKKTTPNYISLL
eukprot:CAMPEP_0183309516 /NCGR_PEP_ID=MMETSP0160_2-20130417/25388_1 /TAXON_ID=2839 ORGANISM="Odontella Sinensis, Strain Grunow 1884" /NCGR_SAMPLE_ID=MMETSP0160_2 /ASSEMBLY_ACC=CAM_ASM_000250 /LENGTH=322 /DNA_ID=CAMNT_0025473557 /DNA_START=78 /DNA_END=1046 /DNA_ORIENTATION=-